MMVLSIDVTPWAVAAAVVGALLGASIPRQRYNVFAVLSAFFAIYATTPIFGMPYNMYITIAWLLAVAFGAATMTNLVSTWVRRIEMQMQTLMRQMEVLRLTVEEK
jgi:sorbitol-specific phosphotransferase system component IIBC